MLRIEPDGSGDAAAPVSVGGPTVGQADDIRGFAADIRGFAADIRGFAADIRGFAGNIDHHGGNQVPRRREGPK